MQPKPAPPHRRLLTPAEVAVIFRVDTAAVYRWGRNGRLSWTMTPGGHRRYFEDEVQSLAAEQHRGRS